MNPLCSCQSSIAALIVGGRKLAISQSGSAFSVVSIFIFVIFVILVPISLIFFYFRLSIQEILTEPRRCMSNQSCPIININLFNLFNSFWTDPWSLILDPRSSILDPRSSILDPRSSILNPMIRWSLIEFFSGKNWLLLIKLNSPPYPPYGESPGNSFLVFLGYPSRIRQKPGYHSYRSFQHGSGAGRMWLISISKDFLDVSKRTIVAKVKSFFYHLILSTWSMLWQGRELS